MVKVEISRSAKSLTLKLPLISTDKVLISSNELPSVKIQANTCEFTKKQNHLERTVQFDEQEIDMYSSAIEFVNYLPKEKALIVNFWNSACYLFYNIPDILYAFLVVADSKGKVFHQLIQKQYKHKLIPENFSVEDVKEILEQEANEEELDLPDMGQVSQSVSDPVVLSQFFKTVKSEKEKIQILQNPSFSINDHFSEIKDSFWLSVEALKTNRLTTEQMQELKEKKNHQYFSSPFLKGNTKNIIVPQWAIYCTHISGLETIPQINIIEEGKETLKKGQALMSIDSEGNLKLLKFKINF